MSVRPRGDIIVSGEKIGFGGRTEDDRKGYPIQAAGDLRDMAGSANDRRARRWRAFPNLTFAQTMYASLRKRSNDCPAAK